MGQEGSVGRELDTPEEDGVQETRRQLLLAGGIVGGAKYLKESSFVEEKPHLGSVWKKEVDPVK